jgi:hypothetical protein
LTLASLAQRDCQRREHVSRRASRLHAERSGQERLAGSIIPNSTSHICVWRYEYTAF